MTEGMPALIAAEIDSYDQVLQRAIKAEQELAAAEAENKDLRKRIEAVALACQQASISADFCDCDEPAAARALVHSVLGPFGADWDLAPLVELIRNAAEVEWVDGMMGHHLRVLEPDRIGRPYFFDVSRTPVDGGS